MKKLNKEYLTPSKKAFVLSCAIVIFFFIVLFVFKAIARDKIETDFARYYQINTAITLFGLMMPAVILGRVIYKKDLKTELKKPTKNDLLVILPGLSFMLLSWLVVSIFTSLITQEAVDNILMPSNLNEFLLFVIHMAVFPAIIEEIVFREVLYKAFKTAYSDSVAPVLFPSFIFALLHSGIPQCVNAFLCGIILGNVRDKTDNILCSVILHFLFNLNSVVITGLTMFLNAEYLQIGLIIYYVIYFFIILSGIIVALKRYNNKKKMN